MSFPLELDGKTNWPENKARAKYEQFRKEAVAEMRARDISRGLPPDGSTYVVRSDEAGHKSVEVNPLWAAQKHTGDETMMLVEDKWAAFCEDPHSSGEFVIPRITRAERRAKNRSNLPALETPEFPRVDDGVGQSLVTDVPRRRGRPRRAEMLSV